MDRMDVERAEGDRMPVWVSLVRASLSVMARFDLYLKETFDLPFADVSLLAQLHLGNDVPMAELARRMHMTRAGVTKMAHRLEKAGILRRIPSPADNRVIHIQLTDEGRRRNTQIRPHFREWIAVNVTSLMTDEEAGVVADVLLRVARHNGAVIPEPIPGGDAEFEP